MPSDVAKLMLAAVDDIAAFRPLVGVTTAPQLRGDGSICITDGYDAESQLFCDYTELPPLDIPDHPTEEDAKASQKGSARSSPNRRSPIARSITRIRKPPTSSRPSVTMKAPLNGLLLGAGRASMELALAIIVRATDGNSGAGKTTLARAIACIAFGRRVAGFVLESNATTKGKWSRRNTG